MSLSNRLTYSQIKEFQTKGELGEISCLEFRVQEKPLEERNKVRLPILKKNEAFVCLVSNQYKEHSEHCRRNVNDSVVQCSLFQSTNFQPEEVPTKIEIFSTGEAEFIKSVQFTGKQFLVYIPWKVVTQLHLKKDSIVSIRLTKVKVTPIDLIVKRKKNLGLDANNQ